MARVQTNDPATKRSGRSAPLIAFAVGIFVLVVVALASLVPARPVMSSSSCVLNLRQLDGGKEQWALEHKATNLAPVNVPEMMTYIKGGRLVCPNGGEYHVNYLGLPPQCSKSDHKYQDRCRESVVALNNGVRLWLLDHLQ